MGLYSRNLFIFYKHTKLNISDGNRAKKMGDATIQQRELAYLLTNVVINHTTLQGWVC